MPANGIAIVAKISQAWPTPTKLQQRLLSKYEWIVGGRIELMSTTLLALK